jgi:galactonate dehydratase
MKITAVEPLPIDRYLFVQVHTDEGITGLGESGAWGHLEASEAAMRKFADYLVGRDPFTIEHHQDVMHRWSYFRGAAIMSAISAIDIALWDIKGKALGVPVWQLLGGQVRDKVRVYYHVIAPTLEDQLVKMAEAKAAGFTAVGHLNPFLDEPEEQRYFQTHSGKIAGAVEAVRRYRQAAGDDVDLCIEIHRRLTQAEAITLGRAIEEFRPMFFEDPVPPDNIDSMAEVARQIGIPIATGERLLGLSEFAMLVERHAAQYLRPCICVCGGISAGKKIAALAEAHGLGIVPHNPLSPLSTAACLQVGAAIPNLAIQEWPGAQERPPQSEIVLGLPKAQNGFIPVPTAPGIGVSLAPDAQKRFPPKKRPVRARLHVDGSVVDQ